MKKIILISFLNCLFAGLLHAQDTTDLMVQLEKQAVPETIYTTATFKTTRLINGHSSENIGQGVLDVKISHRFGEIDSGGYNLFGLDVATMRMGFDYGITNNI